ncbi:MAG: protein kinase [Isosphaerales bacterium]
MAIRSSDLEGLTLANGRYLITAKLGEGGMGSVYRALDRNIESDVVIKIPRQAMMEDPEFASRFTREIRSLVKLSHPHIVKVSDVGEWESTPFAVMQFLPGGSLEDQRPAGPDGQPHPCDPKQVPRWLEAVAEALDYIHTEGYVHRDVKPGNILFDALGHAFLSDFGVAKVLASSADKHPSQTAMTGTGMVLGTPEYMAPELIMGEPFDGRVDQYALAVTVYELLCGRRPFENETKTKVLVLHTTKAPPRLTEWCPTLPERLSQAVLRGLSKDPNERYSNCVALAAAVAAAAEGAAAREERVRLKCPRCGKTGGMPAADYARLKESGGRASCSACKSPLEVVSAAKERAAPGDGPGGTMRISRSGVSGDYASSSEPEPTRGGTTALSAIGGSGQHAAPRGPQTAAGGTTAMSAPGRHGEQPLGSGPRPTSARRASQTVTDVAAPQSDKDAAAVVFNALQTSEAARPTATAGKKATAAEGGGASPPHPARTWVAVAAGAAGSLLYFTLVAAGLATRHETKPATPALAQKDAPGASQPAPVLTPSPPSRPETPERLLAETSEPKSTRLAAATGPESAPSSGLATTTEPRDREAVAHPASPARRAPAVVAGGKARPAAIKYTSNHFDPALLARKPIRDKVTLAKVLAAPHSYSGQLVVPTGMYSLARSQHDRPGGPRKYLVSERKIESNGHGGALQMDSSFSTDLELDPRLAEHLERLDPAQRRDKVAILTLWVTTGGDCVLVQVEILEKAIPRIKKLGYTVQADIEYQTHLVTPERSSLGKGIDTDWEVVGRMISFAHHYKHQFRAMKRMFQAKEQDQMTFQMNKAFGQMMQSALAEDQARLRRQQSLTGGR